MASISRYFFPNSGTAPVSPSADTSWNDTTQFDRVALGRSHKNETSATKTEVFNGTTPAFVLMRQFVSEPLFAQTIAGHIKGQIRGITSQAAKLGMVAVAVRIVKNDGTDYASPKVLLAPTSADLAATPPFLATTTATNRSFNDAAEGASIALTSQTAVTGDRLVIELGVRDTVAHVSRTLGLSFGGTTVTDLAEDNTTTTANYPWIEFDSSIVLLPYETAHVSETVTAKRYGDATPADELIHVTDTVTATMDLAPSLLSETTHVTDTVTAALDLSVPTFALLTHRGDALGVNGGTSGALDTTGADLLVVALGYDANAGTIATISDSPGNSFTALIAVAGDDNTAATRVFYCVHPKCSATHTVTVSETGAQVAVTVAAFSSPIAYDSENGFGSTGNVTGIASGVAVPTQPNDLFVTAASALVPVLGLDATTARRYTLLDSVAGSAGVNYNSGLAFRWAPTIVASNASWTSNGTSRMSAAMAAFTTGAIGDQCRVADSVVVALDHSTPILTETIHVSDSDLTAVLVTPAADLDATASELTHVRDGGIATKDGIATLWGAIRVTDTVTAEMEAPPGGDLSVEVTSELVHVSDSVTPALTPLEASLAETVHVSESVQTTLNPLEASPSEIIHVSDAPQTTLNPLATAPSELIHVTDLVTASLTVLLVSLDETVHVSDTAIPALTPLETALTETIHVTDTVQAAIGDLSVTVNELVHVTDTPLPALTPLQTAPTETIHVSESVTASLDTLVVSLSETIHVTDTVTPALAVGASLAEAITVTDTLTIGLELYATASELCHVTDSASTLLTVIQASVTETVIVSDADLAVELFGEQIIQRRPTTDPGSVGSRSSDARMISL